MKAERAELKRDEIRGSEEQKYRQRIDKNHKIKPIIYYYYTDLLPYDRNHICG